MEQNMNNNNNMSQDNKEALLRELNKKAKTGNILRGIGIGAFTAFGATSIIMQSINTHTLDKVNNNLSEIQDTVDDISGVVFDIMEQGCNGQDFTIDNIDPQKILETLKHDKKSNGKIVKFILLKKVGKAYIDETVTDEEILAAIREIHFTEEDMKA